MSSNLIKGIVFDFDGTLVQPSLNFKEMNQAAIKAVSGFMPDYPPKEEPALEWLQKVYAKACALKGKDFAKTVYQAADLAMAEVEVNAVKEGGLFPETRSVLERLKASGIVTAIITRNCRRAVLTALPDLDRFCSCLLTRDDISKWKPNPAHLEVALKAMNLPAEQVLMVGDDPMDIKVGKACGTRTAALFCGHVSKDTLVECKPDFVVANCQKLLDDLTDQRLLNLN